MPLKSEALYEPQKGDRVRVVLEGDVLRCSGSGLYVGSGQFQSSYVDVTDGHVLSIEKLEPPVETFKPGDVVRSKYTDYKFLLAEGGYVDLLNNIWNAGEHHLAQFTSKHYERVNLQEAPF